MAAEKGMSVRDVVLDMVGDKKCGETLTDVDPKPVPTDGKAIWVGGEGGGGFTHRGPCELYIDETMVLKSDDCSEDYPTDGGAVMSEMPIDYSSCNGDCIFTIYWLGFQNAQWQAYVNCVPLTGNGSPTTSAETTDAPSTETQPSGSSSSETTTAPSTEETEAPASEASLSVAQPKEHSTDEMAKCTVSRRLREKKIV
ncbi:hypothetical protein JM16_005243 [Phytophthora kernoviae]|uniref:Uncharacterized protein n=1 Tax=Phytophthora kernoviae TaxID=325452 RepID=A0A8T0LSS7_9STRA|nr:hypothetical protein JM16_005243 [Phytophthora kernoviae]